MNSRSAVSFFDLGQAEPCPVGGGDPEDGKTFANGLFAFADLRDKYRYRHKRGSFAQRKHKFGTGQRQVRPDMPAPARKSCEAACARVLQVNAQPVRDGLVGGLGAWLGALLDKRLASEASQDVNETTEQRARMAGVGGQDRLDCEVIGFGAGDDESQRSPRRVIDLRSRRGRWRPRSRRRNRRAGRSVILSPNSSRSQAALT
jgi:hypothetical protein